jgi:hypothetical protein
MKSNNHAVPEMRPVTMGLTLLRLSRETSRAFVDSSRAVTNRIQTTTGSAPATLPGTS